MSCQLQSSPARACVTCPKCPCTPLARAYSIFQPQKYLRTLVQNFTVKAKANPCLDQPSPTEAASNYNLLLACNEPSRRILLARCAALCAASTLAGVPFFARPSVAAALVDEDIAVQVFQDVSPSVVSIAVLRSVGGVQVRDVIGSGVVWDAAGPHVLTNFHIIPPLQGTNTVLEVTLQDMATGAYSILPARVAGSDSLHDLAVLKLLLPQQQPQPQSEEVLGSQLSVARDPASSDGVSNGVSNANGVPVVVAPIRVAAPGDLRVGQLVYALGCVAANPAAAAPTRSLSVGLISGLGRSIPSPVGARIYGVVQTEAVVNAANSGGPLVDSAGRMVGLSTAVGAAQTGTARGSGVNFALPVDLLLDVVPKIIVYGNPYGKK